MIPSLLCAALLVTFLYQDAKLYQTNFSYSRLNNSKQVSMAGLATTFVNDIIITSGICIRLVLLTNPTLGVAIKKRNHQLIAVLVESAALTTINVIFEFIAFVREDNVHLLANYISGQLYGLATYIIILRAIKLTVFPANMSNTPRMPSTVSNKPTRFEGLDAPYGAIEEGRERRSSAAQMPSSVYEIRSPSSSKGSPATLLNERFSSKETYTPSPAMEMGTFPTPVYEAASSEGKDTDDDPSNDTSSIPFGLALGTPHDSHHHHWDSHTRGNSRSLGGRALGHRNDSSNENFVQLTTQTLSIVSPPSHSLVQTRAQMNSHDEEFAPVSTSPAPASSASPPPAFTSPEPTSPRSPGGSPAPSRSLRDIKQAMQASQPGAQSPPLHNSSSPFPHSSFVGGYDDY